MAYVKIKYIQNMTKYDTGGYCMELLLIHLTDIHISDENDFEILVSRSKSISNVISKHITNAKNTKVIFCITGDIAHSGKEEQYIWATLFFEEIISNVKKQYEVEFIFGSVPGNHDCDFDVEENEIRNVLDMSSVVNKLTPQIIKACTSIQNNYFDFTKRLEENLKNKIYVTSSWDNLLITQNEYEIQNDTEMISIKFHCINSAWCSSKNEIKGKMYLKLDNIGEKINNEIVITLMHHDEAWLDWNSCERWKDYYKDYSDIILVGHDHFAEFVHKENYNENSNYFIKGNQLYSKENPEQSGFNVLKIDLSSNIQRFFTYSWNGSLYENIIDTKALVFNKNRFKKSGIELKKEILEYVENIEFDIVSKYKDKLLLSDIYVFPLLLLESETNRSRVIYKDKKDIIELIKAKKYVTISGEKEYGKTALIKQLFKHFYEEKLCPVFVPVTEITTADGEELNKKIGELYCKQYNNLEEEVIMQMNPEQKVCLIDNFENVNLSGKTVKKLLHYLMEKFSTVIITTNYQSDMLNFLTNIEVKDFLNENFTKASIQELGKYGKRKLTDKWILLGNPDKNIESQEFDTMRNNILVQIESIMKDKYFNKTPIEYLLVLSYLENYQRMNTDYSRYSYIYDCLVLDKINEISNDNTNEATMYKTILEQLAFTMYENKNDLCVDEATIIGVIFDYNQEYTGLKGEIIDTVRKLEQSKILEKKDNTYKFKNNYMYYYFAGSYIKNQMSHEKREEKIIEIFSKLSTDINFKIALFLAYSLNKEYEILPKIKYISNTLLVDYKKFEYSQHTRMFEKINYDINEKIEERFSIPKNENIPYIQDKKALLYDELTDESLKDINDEKDEDMDRMSQELIKALRIIEFLGDILKNYSSSIKREPRLSIIQVMYELNLKILGLLCDSLGTIIDQVIEIIDEKVKEDNVEILQAKSEFKMEISKYMSRIWMSIVEINASNLSYSLQCDRIDKEVSDFQREINSCFFNMVRVGFLIRTQNGKLPIKEISACIKGKDKLDTFSQNVLKKNVAAFLCNNQYDSRDKQAVCSLLDFNIQDLFVEEQKRIVEKQA